MARNRFGAKPVHLFVFTRQHLVWRYCTADRDLVINGKTYLSAQIGRSEIKQTVERAKDKITITFAYLLDPAAPEYPVTQPLGDNWFPHVPQDVVGVTCLAYDAGNDDPPAVEWIGEVTQPKFSDTELELTCEPDNGYSRARNQGPRWQRGCWKTPYSTGPRGCNLTGGASTVTGTITRIEAANGDMPPQAHVLVPSLGGYIQVLAGKTATWAGGASSSLIAAAYFAYTRRRVTDPPMIDETTFSWDDIGNNHDRAERIGPITIYYTYTRHPALILADATGLAVGSTISIDIPALATTGTVTAVDGTELTVPELAGSAFGLAGGFITFVGPGGLAMRRDIASHVQGADKITLTPGGQPVPVGTVVSALPTCARTWAACSAFGNTPHYGGSVYKPVKNPMEGVSMSWG